jgi:hypothetical protein
MNVLKTTQVVVLFFVCASTTQAATLYIDPGTTELKRGDTAMLSVRVDTDEGECINAVDATLTYSENIEPIDVSRGSSIMPIWIEEPTINRDTRTITFAGGIPNGYCGRIPGDPRLTNTIVDILFMSPGLAVGTTESGNVARIQFAETTRLLLNDGFGTEAPRTLIGSDIVLDKAAGTRVENEWLDVVENDTIPPEDFTIVLERTENAFSNDYFIVFNTTDKQSGIAYYEVMEEPLELRDLFTWGAADAPWVEAKSPYVLTDQSLNSTIRVKAVDKAGNEYIATLLPDEASRGIPFSYYIVGILVLIVITLLGTLLYVVWRRYARRRSQHQEEDSAQPADEYDTNE